MSLEVKFSHEIPEVYQELHKKFGVEWENGVIITYGDTIYCKNKIPPDFIVHEIVHIKQQARGQSKEFWFRKYLDDPKFRLEMEVEAYREQIRFIRQEVKDRNKSFRMIDDLIRTLSSPMYGNLVSYGEARKLLYF